MLRGKQNWIAFIKLALTSRSEVRGCVECFLKLGFHETETVHSSFSYIREGRDRGGKEQILLT